MPKRVTTARSRAQRNKPKVQRAFELVLPERDETEVEEGSSTPVVKESTVVSQKEESRASGKESTAVSQQEGSKVSGKESKRDRREQGPSVREEAETKAQEEEKMPARSASARMAARRQAAQKLQQRAATTLITSEHFAYVRRDLIRIAVFAVLMFTAIIVLYFTLGHS